MARAGGPRWWPALVAQVRALRETVGLDAATPTTLSADAGSFSHDNAAEDGEGIDLPIAAGRDDPAARPAKPGTVFSADLVGYDPAADQWVCPRGTRLVRRVTSPGALGRPAKNRSHADPTACLVCPRRAACLVPHATHRVVVVRRGRAAGAMRLKLRQAAARRRSARRTVIVEPVFGPFTEARGCTTRSLRGLVLARAEYLRVCRAHNLGKLLRVCPLPVARVARAVAA